MKSGIHPKTQKTTATCSCGAVFVFESTVAEIKTEVCSACHPFYTGKQKLVDTAGKVDKFRARMKAAEVAKTSKKKSKISESVKAAAAAHSVARTSAVDSKKAVKKVKSAVTKRELAKAKLEEELKAKSVEQKVEEAKPEEAKAE
ncbi:MAG: 50S ribosomal protein L31 [Patescibacteria group bacterium]